MVDTGFTKSNQDSVSGSGGIRKLVIVAIVVTVLAIAGLVYWAFFMRGFNTWTNDQYGISIQYPVQWQPTKSSEGALVVFLSPKQGVYDLFLENVNVAVQDLSETPMLLEEFTKIAKSQLNAVLTNVEIVEQEDVVIDYKRGHRITFLAKDDQDMRVTIIWFMDGNLAYTLTYMALDSDYETYLPLAEKMFESFKFEK